MRKHRDHTVYQINTGSAVFGFHIQRAVLLHIIAHVRDMNAEAVQISLFGQGNRIIEILCVLTVDRHHLPVPQIQASRHVRLTHLVRDIFNLTHDLWRKLHRNIIRFYERHDIHTRIIDMTDDLGHLSLRLLSVFSVIRDRHDHLMSGHGSHGTFFRDKDILRDLRIVRHYKAKCLIILIGSDHFIHTVGKDLCDRSLSAFSACCRRDDKLHGIHVHGSVHLFRRNKDVLIHTLDGNKTESLWMAGKNTGLVFFFGFYIFAFFRELDFSVLYQRIHHARKLGTVTLWHLHQDCKFL